jgi:O-acetylserine/cysteine efflux transporter
MTPEHAAGGAGPSTLAGRDLFLLVAINVVWGLNLVASKLGVGEFPPIFFTALRFGSLALVLVPLLRWHPGQMRNLLAATLLTGPASFALMFSGLYYVQDASTAAITSQLNVPLATLFSVWLLGERINLRRVSGIVLAFAGVLVIGFDPRVLAYSNGILLVVASTFTGALGLIYVKKLRSVKPLELQAWIAVIGGPGLLLLSFLFESGQVAAMRAATWVGWVSLAFTAVMASLLAHSLWYYLIGRYPVTTLAPVTLLTPVCGVLFSVLLLGDQLTLRMLLGGAITLAGVFVVVGRDERIAALTS